MQNEQNTNAKLSLNLLNGSKNGVVSQQPDGNQNTTSASTKIKRKNKCDLGADFVAPDGGWGWLVVVAAGVSNVSFRFARQSRFFLSFAIAFLFALGNSYKIGRDRIRRLNLFSHPF